MKNTKGLTLIEVIISMGVLVFLGAGLLSLQYILGQNQTLVLKNFVAIDEANSNIDSFVKEIRGARTSDNGAYPLERVQDNEIIFYSDIDFDGQTERIRYTLSGNSFSKGVIEPIGQPVTYPAGQEVVNTISANVRNGSKPVFYYYNGNWPKDTQNNPLDTAVRLSQTRTVRIYLRLNTLANEPEKDFILESFSNIRMLKDNL